MNEKLYEFLQTQTAPAALSVLARACADFHTTTFNMGNKAWRLKYQNMQSDFLNALQVMIADGLVIQVGVFRSIVTGELTDTYKLADPRDIARKRLEKNTTNQ